MEELAVIHLHLSGQFNKRLLNLLIAKPFTEIQKIEFIYNPAMA
jgi:hypothetical protein